MTTANQIMWNLEQSDEQVKKLIRKLKENEFPRLENDLLLRAALGKKVEQVPAWIMRQAGRYLPEFKELRKQYTFFEMCGNPVVACEVTMQPIRRLPLDAAIIFSDILVIPMAMGMDLKMVPGEGPVFPKPLRGKDLNDFEELTTDVLVVKERLQHVYDAIFLTRHRLNGQVPLIGFAGGPWTLFSYMVEGAGSKTFALAKSKLYSCASRVREILETLSSLVAAHLNEQVRHGAQLVQIFESNAGHLTPAHFTSFVLPCLQSIRSGFLKLGQLDGRKPVPMTIFAKGAWWALPELRDVGFEVVGLDWTHEPQQARQILGPTQTIQGNLDPCALYGDKELIESKVAEMLKGFGNRNYIANLGHGIYPDTDPEKVAFLLESIRKQSAQL